MTEIGEQRMFLLAELLVCNFVFVFCPDVASSGGLLGLRNEMQTRVGSCFLRGGMGEWSLFGSGGVVCELGDSLATRKMRSIRVVDFYLSVRGFDDLAHLVDAIAIPFCHLLILQPIPRSISTVSKQFTQTQTSQVQCLHLPNFPRQLHTRRQ